ncbi:hypothetical protein FVA74_12230 [Salinibacterium sp. dk2585]|uniref:hypothetical protein n=1 Tax=unclassified Salinibacterium TaxID=2632331 RepID=UPI0011C25041|nr:MULTISPECIES: hypothetical protein [unclassified Salinibacterium]QEE62259.1 hypothetical protein FVA74_12230 [Salinibacterium sp. dk2585]TXK53611.1 hypothetical protein FVP63_10500 [Salinibacterium sp. dk5596]
MADRDNEDDITSGKRGGSHADSPNSAPRDVAHSEAPIDQMADQPQAGSEQNPPLADSGPTDGEHGTDNDPELNED